MSDFYNSNIIPKILRIFKVKNLVISNVTDKQLIDEINTDNFNITLINTPDKESIKDNPLDVLKNLKNYDAIFIDGDANWYTVFNELNIIKKSNDEFPLVFICNNIFPNKRRDSYINPDEIPKEFRHNFVKELSICHNDKMINIVDGYYHACEENTPKNGVLTAIEDFLSMNSAIGVMKINFVEDITILYQKLQINQKRINMLFDNIKNEKVDDINLSDKLIENKLLISYIHKYNLFNDNLNEYEVEISKNRNRIKDYENKLRLQNTEIIHKTGQIENIESKLSLKDSQIKNFESKLINKEKKIDNLEDQLKNANNTLTENNSFYNNKISSLENDFNTELTIKNYELNSLKDELKQKEQDFNSQIINKDLNIQQKDYQLKIKQDELNNQERRLSSLKQCYTKQLAKIDNNEYCISCFKDEISNNHLEIKYLQNNILTKKILSPIAYLYLIFKSNPKEIPLNIKLYQTLKDSNCFDIGFYLNKNKDLVDSKWCKYFSPELHYVCNGFKEERTFNKKYFNINSKKELLDYLLTCDK